MARKQYGTATAVAADLATKAYADAAAAAVTLLAGPCFRAYRATSDQTFSSATATKVQLNAENFDTTNAFDSATNYRFTPAIAGYYHFDFQLSLQSSAAVGAVGYAAIFKNGAEVNRGSAMVPGASTGYFSYYIASGSGIVYMNGSTDYIELFAFVTAASGTISVNFSATPGFLSFLSGHLIEADSWMVGNSDSVTEGSTNKYYTDTRVRAAVLTGLSTATNSPVAATDTVLAAIGLLQAQVIAPNISSFSAARPVVAADAGTTLYHPSSDTTARTVTLPANATIPMPVGSVITVDNDISAGIVTIAITTDTLVLVGAAGTTGSRTLAAGGRAVMQKVTTTRWRISGVGLT
jgi:hypothetical protein